MYTMYPTKTLWEHLDLKLLRENKLISTIDRSNSKKIDTMVKKISINSEFQFTNERPVN